LSGIRHPNIRPGSFLIFNFTFLILCMSSELITHQDQMGWFITLPKDIRRIVSLVPSQTEYLCSLGLEDRIVGITKFCVHPESCYRSKIRVGGTKDFDMESIRLLNPDLIIANKEENEEEHILKLKAMFPVWISDVRNYDQAIDMMRRLGAVLNKETKAGEIIRKTGHNFSFLRPLTRKLKVVYFIWRKPYMTVNRDTFIHSMLEKCGFENVFADHAARYPKVTADDLERQKPDVILLSSEPYPFREKHLEEIAAVYPEARILLVDGELFSWYGSRLMHAPAYYNKLLAKLTA